MEEDKTIHGRGEDPILQPRPAPFPSLPQSLNSLLSNNKRTIIIFQQRELLLLFWYQNRYGDEES